MAQFWVQQGERWQRTASNLKAIGALGVVGLVATHTGEETPNPSTNPPTDAWRSWRTMEYLGFFVGPEGSGVTCASSKGLSSWGPVGPRALDGWEIRKVRDVGPSRFVALESKTLGDGTTENALFESKDCRTWSNVRIRDEFRFQAVVNSITQAADRWFLSGWKRVPSEKYRRLLAVGSSYREFRMIDLSSLGTDQNRGIYTVAGLSKESVEKDASEPTIIALAFDFSAGLGSAETEYGREDIAVPVIMRRAHAIRVPVLGREYRSNASNISRPR